jgi:hypothetical protein
VTVIEVEYATFDRNLGCDVTVFNVTEIITQLQLRLHMPYLVAILCNIKDHNAIVTIFATITVTMTVTIIATLFKILLTRHQ